MLPETNKLLLFELIAIFTYQLLQTSHSPNI